MIQHVRTTRLLFSLAIATALLAGASVSTMSAAAGAAGPSFRSVSQSTNSATVVKPSGVTRNDLLLAFIEIDAEQVAATGPNGWRKILDTPASAGTPSAFHAQIWYKLATASEPASYHWTGTGGAWVNITLADYSGVNISAPIDAKAGLDTGMTAAPLTPSLTTTHANDLLVGYFVSYEDCSWTAGSGMTQHRFNDANSIQEGMQAVAGITGAKTASCSQAGHTSAQLIAVSAGASPGPTPTVSSSPSASPSPSPSASPSPSPSASPSASPSPLPSPTPLPGRDCSTTMLAQGNLGPPIWCQPPLAPQTLVDTYVGGPNSWVDDFGVGDATKRVISDGYTVFDSAGAQITQTQHFMQSGHWVTDTCCGDDFGGGLMRPSQAFHFVNGKLVVEADIAFSDDNNNPQVNAWPEIDISTSDHPTGIKDNLYGYGVFKGNWAVGCRFEPILEPICAMQDDTNRGEFDGGRIFEISFFQDAGGPVYGGYPAGALAGVWKICPKGTDPWPTCKNRFRWELTRNQLSVYVNGVLYMQHGLDSARQLPDTLVNGNLYVYFADWQYKPGVPARFHWGHVAVNP